MTALILGLLAAYLVYSLAWNFRHPGKSPEHLTVVSGILQGPLMVACAYYAYTQGAFGRELVNLGHIAAGLVLGHLVFSLSIWITQGNWRDAWDHLRDVRGMTRFFGENPGPVLRILAVAFTEEILYRAAVQPVLVNVTGSALFGIVITAAVFSVVHDHFFHNPRLQSIEFAGFALLLGGLYYATGSLILVGVVHSLRNLEIFYIEYLGRCHELGDPGAAQDEIDRAHQRRALRQT